MKELKFSKAIEQYRALVLEEMGEPSFDEQDLLVDAATKEVTFASIDYTSEIRSSWKVSSHLDRAFMLLMLFKREQDEHVKTLFRGAIDHWVRMDYINPNWWHNQIGVPNKVARILLFDEGELTWEEHEALLKILARGSVRGNSEIQRWTGANLLWGISNTIRDALIRSDEELLQYAANRLQEEIGFLREGIQKDYSFFQHDERLYAGGYGRSYLSSITEMLYVLSFTPCTLSQEKIDLLLHFVLEGLFYMTHRNHFDYIALGREHVRLGADGTSGIETSIKRLLKTQNMKRKPELEQYLCELQGAKEPTCRRKFFDVARMLTLHTSSIYIGYKGISPTIYGAEICNGEGVLDYNLSYGTTTCVLDTGKEYTDIYPLWDYSALPGTTAPQESDEVLFAKPNFTRARRNGPFFLGGNEASYSYIQECIEHDGIKTYRTAIATEEGMVIITKLERIESNEPLRTTLEQCLACGRECVVESPKSIVLGNVRYSILDTEHSMEFKKEERTGNVNRNNLFEGEGQVQNMVWTISLCGDEKSAIYRISDAHASCDVTVLENSDTTQVFKYSSGLVLRNTWGEGVKEI